MVGRKEAVIFECTLCDSDIPADADVEPGDTVYCSYCKLGLRVVQGKGEKLVLEPMEEE